MEQSEKGEINPEQYITDLNGTLASFLDSKPEFQKKARTFSNTNNHKPASGAHTLNTSTALQHHLSVSSVH